MSREEPTEGGQIHDTAALAGAADRPVAHRKEADASLLLPSQLVDQRNAADHIADILREAICTGVLGDGEVLNQADLAARFGVSRIPMREALRILQGEGLVDVRPHHKALVASLTPSALGEIFEMRELIELHLLDPAFDQITETVVRRLVELCGQMEDGIEEDKWLTLTRDFHDTLLGPAQRPMMLDAMARYRRLGERYQFLAMGERRKRRVRANKDHRRIVAAIEQDDRQLGREVLRGHIRSAGAGLLRSLEQQTASTEG